MAMKPYEEMSLEEQKRELERLKKEYQQVLQENLSLNMARGKPCKAQLDLSNDMMNVLKDTNDCLSEDGTDCRNYGLLTGIIEARRLVADLAGVKAENVLVGGNSSLNLMYTLVADAMLYGIAGEKPMKDQGPLKWLCPCPGYDRHFRITESLGFELIPIPMKQDGPDMDMVEEYVKDPSVKGIWCVPKYSNPDGYSYGDETVRRFAALTPAAKDFRIYWDNAYMIHHLDFDHPDEILNIMDECARAGHPDLVVEFMSTSKIVFPGAGISAIITSTANMEEIKKQFLPQIIGFDKMNQMRHVKYFHNADGVMAHMKKHAAIVQPHFQVIFDAFKELGDLHIARWTTPKGGYFISLYTLNGCAKRTFDLCKQAGVLLTSPGAAFPYGKDPDDSHIRIAPTFPSLEELKKAASVLQLCVKIASLEKMLA